MPSKKDWVQSSDLLQRSPDKRIQGIIDKLSILDQLNQSLHKLLEPTLVGHCRIANIDGGCLLIEVDSPTWATPLQYQLPSLLKKFRETHPYITFKKADCYVKKLTDVAVKKRYAKPLSISQENADTLSCIADQIADPRLKKILAQIAKHGH